VTLESAAGTGDLAVFHWWLKSLADDVLDQAPGTLTLADRYRTHVETPCADAPQRPILIPADRPLPRITKVRYDVFYKYIKAHLPELRDLGRDFPSPERFDELAFKWLQPMLVGQGRMILIAGLAKQGLHLFWLGDQGFEKSVYVPTDSFPEPIVKADDQKVYVIASMAGTLQTHEMLWWGP
jgi:hypothetical protein